MRHKSTEQRNNLSNHSHFSHPEGSEGEFSHDFWENKVGTWEILTHMDIDKIGFIKTAESFHRALYENKELKKIVEDRINNIFVNNKNGNNNIGKACVTVFLNPDISNTELKKELKKEPAMIDSNWSRFPTELRDKFLVDSIYMKGKGKTTDVRLTPSYHLCQLLFGKYDGAYPEREYLVWDKLKIQKNVVLLLLKNEHENIILVKNGHDSPIPYLRNKLSLPYFFINTSQKNLTDIELTKKEICNIDEEIYGKGRSGFDKNNPSLANLYDNLPENDFKAKTRVYFPPLQGGGNVLYFFDAAGIPRSTVNYIISHVKKGEMYNIDKVEEKSMDNLWEGENPSMMEEILTNGESIHYASIISTAYEAIRYNFSKADVSKKLKWYLHREFVKKIKHSKKDKQDILNELQKEDSTLSIDKISETITSMEKKQDWKTDGVEDSIKSYIERKTKTYLDTVKEANRKRNDHLLETVLE